MNSLFYMNRCAFDRCAPVRRTLWPLVLAASVGLLHTPAVSAQPMAELANGAVSAAVLDRYPAGSINSMEAADAALVEINRARSEIDARFAAEEQACHPKFFTTSCIENAKERRRQESAPLRKIELEAEQYKRQARLNERDEAAAQRREKEDVARQERIRPQRENDAGEEPGRAEPESSAREEPAPVLSDRGAEHDARLKRIQEKDAANAERRALNVVKYEKKVREAQERQKKIAQKKAEKEAARQTGQSAPHPGAQ